MSSKLDSLTDEEVGQITQLVGTLEKSNFDFLELSVGNLKVTLGKGSVPIQAPAHGSAALSIRPAPLTEPVPTPPAAPAVAPAPLAATAAAAGPASAASNGTVEVNAPMMGRFYARPEPGAAPFVSVGTQVSADSTLGLIEVMKVFTAVRAGVAGIITDICVQDAEFIEYGHVLFRMQPTKV